MVNFNGGTLNSSGIRVNNGAAFAVGDTGLGATLNLPGGTNSFNNGLTVGNSGAGNSLLIANGAKVSVTGIGCVGNTASASNNLVLIIGAGSRWSSSGNLMVGNSGSGNMLILTNGGQVSDSNGTLGNAAGANYNSAFVTGSNSVWNNSATVAVGRIGAFNQLTIANGGQVIVPYGTATIGDSASASNNSVLVTGAGSLWDKIDFLYVGNYGANNQLTIANGGRVNVACGGNVGANSTNNILTIAGAGSIAYGVEYIGSRGSFNQLIVTNGGTVLECNYLGWQASASNNSALVSGADSVWQTAYSIYAGGAGAGNRLTVANGGAVYDAYGYVGLTGSNNSALITGAGSLWSNSSALYVGGGFSNSLTIANGGTVTAPNITVAGTGDVLTVSGGLLEVRSNLTINPAASLTNFNGGDLRFVSGATLNVSGSFVITNATLEFAGTSTAASPFLPGITFQNASTFKWAGYGGSFGTHAITGNLDLDLPSGQGLVNGIVDNAKLTVGGGGGLLYVGSNNLDSLAITNGGWVLDNVAYLGFTTSASNNSATVGGVGSLWSNSSSLFVGYAGSGNSLILTNGGVVWVTNVVVGTTSSSTGNVVTVSGGILDATNSAGGGAINVLYGTLNLNSGTVAVDRLLLTNGVNSVFNFNGGVLQAGQVLSAQPVTVNGGTLTLASSFVNSPGGTLQLNSGGMIVPGSMANQGTFIQNGGMFDPLVFTNSGSFILNSGTNMDGVFLNLASGSVQQSGGEHDVNVATNYGSWALFGGVANLTNLVIDGGGVFTNAGGMLVSTNASGTGGVDVRNGTLALLSGTVTVNQFYATNGVNSVVSFNGGTLNSGGTVVSNGSAFIVGDTGSGAALNLVGGTHSFSSDLIIGNSGSSNSFLITNGGRVLVTGDSILGQAATSSGNSALVTGAGSVWSNSGALCVGNLGFFNQLTVAKGGQVFNGSGDIGCGGYPGESGNSNTVTITDSGSLWSNSDQLRVGYLGSGNTLTIVNGGLVSCNGGSVGSWSDGNNAALVTGAGSVWSNRHSLTVGICSSDNLLTIGNGAAVFNGGDSLIGYFNANSNAVLVTGPGSVWNIGDSGGLGVGEGGSGNSLTIANGGLVLDANGWIGDYDSFAGNNNTVLVTGAGSVWSNSASLVVGYNGSGNSLFIANGGMVTATNVTTGGSPSAGNVLSVSGGWLYATNTTASGALNVQFGTLNLNSGTVTVNRFYANNGASSIVSFNGGTLNSGGSTVSNGSIFQVGDGSSTATFDLFGGAHAFANGILINTNAILTGTGAVTGSVTDAGLIAPGNGFGVITDTGDLAMLSSGAMTMELGGTNAWLYDQFDLTGALTFGGTLTVALLNGYTPRAGDQFNLFDFGSGSGAFSQTNLPTLSPTLYWNTSALYSTGVIEADQIAGSLQVILAPQAAIDAGAKWQVDADGNWHTNNETVGGLVAGSHTLSYTNLTGWIAPTNQTVQIATGATTTNNGTYQLTPPLLLAAVSRKAQGGAGTFDLNLNLNGTPSATVEPRLGGPTQLLFTFNKAMAAADGTLDATEFTVTNATFVSASVVSSNLTLNLANVVDQSKVTVVMNGLTDLAGNPLSGTNAVIVRSLYGDVNQSGTVNAVDLQQVKNNLLAALTPANFLCDVNSSGTINAVDLQQIKNNLLHSASLVGDSGTGLSSGDASSSVTTLALSTTTLGEALGATNLTWSTDGDASWTATLAEDGSNAAMSGSIGNLNVSWVEATVTGPGTLSYDWMVSSELNGDYLTFAIDGVDQPGAISGEAGWQTLTFSIPGGTHRLTWTYSKNAATAAGLDTGWLRRVVYPKTP